MIGGRKERVNGNEKVVFVVLLNYTTGKEYDTEDRPSGKRKIKGSDTSL